MVSQKQEKKKPIIESVKESKFLIEYLESSQINPHIKLLFLHTFVVLVVKVPEVSAGVKVGRNPVPAALKFLNSGSAC